MHRRMDNQIVSLHGCSVSLGGKLVLRDVSFRLAPGERWALLGANGSGKTSLLRLLRGELQPADWTPGKRSYGPGAGAPAARRAMSLVSSESQDARVRLGLDVTGMQAVLSGFTDSMYPPPRPAPEQCRRAREAMEELGVTHLADKGLAAMSRGEARIVLLARALATRPRALLLDEFLDGLDNRAERAVTRRLHALAENDIAMVITSHRPERLPGFIHKAALMESGRIIKTGRLQEVTSAYNIPDTPFDHYPVPARKRAAPDYLVRVRRATVRRRGLDVLKDVSLTIRPGERLAVVGPNGAGKSTLFMLIMAGLRPLAGGGIDWFGPNGPSDVFEIRKRIGLVSPELQAGYAYNVTALEFVLSGFDASAGLHREPDQHEIQKALNLISLAGLRGCEKTRILDLSYGQARRLLVARALAPEPDMLLLDEATAGLDRAALAGFYRTVEEAAASGVSIIYAAHRGGCPPCRIDRVLAIDNGRVREREAEPA